MTTIEATTETASWWQRRHGGERDLRVAYFCMEFGVDEVLPIYSGGLGVLAGDHLKAAGELGVPLVGVGLLYRGGYFRQGLDTDGRQTAEYQPVDPEAAGLVREPAEVEVALGGEAVRARVWRKDVGSVPLYLLEADWLTDALYGGDREHRIRQELLLGVGGVRALAALGVEASVFHMNEGHSAFLAIERVRALVGAGWDTDAALEHVRATTVFTTHTPVPAGNEVFAADLVERYVGPLAAEAGLARERLLELGRVDGEEGFGLTPLALRLCAYANGVSELHGRVARETWACLWPGRPAEETPIGHVTNGIHPATWLAPPLAALVRQAGVDPHAAPDEARWERVLALDGEALWRAHESCRARVAEVAGLDPGRLTIGFARRFATYKRAGLAFSQLERLLALPVQVVVAGKAHPADEPGKDVMQAVVRLARDPAHAGRIVFLENYDLGLARALIPGCDVWLNTPRRPLEASGTSGMKAALNGVLNLSVLDGWWAEGHAPEIGWAIDGRTDDEDAEQLYRLLAEEVVPAFFDDRPRWVEMMKASIARTGARYSMHRALAEYAERYLPAHAAGSGGRG
ncbi:MAG: alpha-glucan family phosphorylase [Thermoleophilia bacterium]|nr:alpha-glucan family phosphorylase [Thermoleophilia bacterium]